MMAIMVKLQTMIIVVLSILVIALVAILFIMYERQAVSVTSIEEDKAQLIVQKEIPAAALQTPMSRQTSPPSSELDRYLQKAPISKDMETMRAERQMREDKVAKLKELQTKFKNLSSGDKTPDIEELDRLLGELIAIQGASVVGGVDLNILRQNLRVAQEVQGLAKELEEESKKPSPDQNRVLDITRKIQALQSELKTNIMAGGAADNTPIPPAEDLSKDQKGL
ncbi:MAG: hypothetical protein LBS40_07175 [Burkholderiales bacterium]|jgi:hypothetical protein|nr:hypothetical protein [Burkholderiales bacterium]